MVLLDAQKRLINKSEEVKIKGGYQTDTKTKRKVKEKARLS